jgi:UDP-N-acetylglucosamine--N-acetylmuramyl-(pentapeptide) pyrophosphoryl-undecaprenol N-acetylglucosamine transferase
MTSTRAQEHRLIVLAAGGTGGHLFPAQALAEELQGRQYDVHLLSDSRVREFGAKFPATHVYDIPSATLTMAEPFKLPGRLLRLLRGYGIAKTILMQLQPRVVVGFGGYPSFPPLAAAARLRMPIVLHEANAVLGRANRALAKRASVIASSFPTLANLPPALASRVELTGNPVRQAVLKLARTPYEKPTADKVFRLLVFGGSQGAKFFSEVMPPAIAELPGPLRRKLKLTQQCRGEDVKAVRAKYEELGVEHDVQEFFADMPRRMAAAHLVLCRSGASTVAELGVIGRPALLVPLPHAVDNDQLRNAESFVGAGGGWLLRQDDITPEMLAAVLTRLRYQEAELADAAKAALGHGRPDASKHLADIVERLVHVPARVSSVENIGKEHEATS